VLILVAPGEVEIIRGFSCEPGFLACLGLDVGTLVVGVYVNLLLGSRPEVVHVSVRFEKGTCLDTRIRKRFHDDAAYRRALTGRGLLTTGKLGTSAYPR
jgi:hypothetical protein